MLAILSVIRLISFSFACTRPRAGNLNLDPKKDEQTNIGRRTQNGHIRDLH